MTVICPVTAPATVGLKMIPMAQLPPAASDPLTVPPACGQVVFALVSKEKGPVKPTDVRDSGLAWKLVTVHNLVALVAPIEVAPNAIDVGLIVSGATPFPDRPTVCVPPALVTTVSKPAGAAPSAPGARVTRILHALPAANVPGFGHGCVGAVARA